MEQAGPPGNQGLAMIDTGKIRRPAVARILL
jgi:hypothetical protein